MRFVLREGQGPSAAADVAMLSAIGLPGGGVVSVGNTTVRVVPTTMDRANELHLPPHAFTNSGLEPGATADVQRAVVPTATAVTMTRNDHTLDAVPRDLVGTPVRIGDRLPTADGEVTVVEVHPSNGGILAASTVATDANDEDDDGDSVASSDRSSMTAGLESEQELLEGWLTLLAAGANELSNGAVAGVVIAGSPGSGRSELVAAAAEQRGLHVTAIDLRTVTTAERLLTRLESAISTAEAKTVFYIDRLDPLIDKESASRHQSSAVMRWFLEKIADTSQVAVVIATSRSDIAADLDAADLLRRTLTIPAPSRARRTALLETALGSGEGLDLEALANATPGFSALDISTAVLEAHATSDGDVDTNSVLAAIRNTRPSLGTAHLGDIPTYGFDRVANLVEVKRALTENVIWQLTDPDRFSRMGIEAAKGLLLYGPPGTGKTYVLRALAHESGAAFFPVKGAELLDKWVGESERAVREVFSRARAVAPAIIFFDEIDALAPVRGSSTNNVTDSVVAALLTELDGVGDRGDVFVVGATNRKDLIDPALLRPGRLEVHLHLDVPEPSARMAFLEMTSVPIHKSVDLDRLVTATEGMSFADLEGALRRAAIVSMRDDPHRGSVEQSHLDEALSRP